MPVMKQRIAEPRDVRRLRVRLDGANLTGALVDRQGAGDLQGVGQTVDGNIVELRDPQSLRAGPADPDARRYLSPEPFIESDDPAIVAEAEAAVRGITGVRARAERLTRHVNAMLEKKPTVSLPSARDVLRTRIGDCNEHTALYVALARAVGIPARIAVGPDLRPRRVLLPRLARGVPRRRRWPRLLAARRSHAQSVSRRRHSPAARARRARPPGGDPAAHRSHEDGGPRSRAGARLGSHPRRETSHRHDAAGYPAAAALRRRMLVQPARRRRRRRR